MQRYKCGACGKQFIGGIRISNSSLWDAYSRANLYKQYVKYETNQLYALGIAHLQAKGFVVKAIVCDLRKGLLQLFSGIPVQMCQFHQMATITRYLTRKPKLQAAKQLGELARMLARTDKERFEGGLGQWHEKWETFMNQRSTNETTGKSFYTHKRLRSAYRSLVTNLPWLFTWYGQYRTGYPKHYQCDRRSLCRCKEQAPQQQRVINAQKNEVHR